MSSSLIALVLLAVPASSSSSARDAARTLHESLSNQVLAAYDSSRGGFVTKKGVPVESAVELAWMRSRRAGDGGTWAARARTTLEWTAGLRDTLTGGYFHSSKGGGVDFESLDKRADSNARRLELLLLAWKTTGDDRYKRDADRLVAWFERVLVDGRGGFVAAQIGDRELEPAANGEAIHAWLAWAAATRNAGRRDFALRSLDRVWETCWTEGLGLLRKNTFGDVAKEPQLSDQVEMGRALVYGAGLCGRAEDRKRAETLGMLVLERFEERVSGGYRTQSVPDKNGSIKRARRDPDENARAARFLCELSALTGNDRYRQSAARAWGSFRKEMPKLGLAAADWALATHSAYEPALLQAPEWASSEVDEPAPRKRTVRIKNVRR